MLLVLRSSFIFQATLSVSSSSSLDAFLGIAWRSYILQRKPKLSIICWAGSPDWDVKGTLFYCWTKGLFSLLVTIKGISINMQWPCLYCVTIWMKLEVEDALKDKRIIAPETKAREHLSARMLSPWKHSTSETPSKLLHVVIIQVDRVLLFGLRRWCLQLNTEARGPTQVTQLCPRFCKYLLVEVNLLSEHYESFKGCKKELWVIKFFFLIFILIMNCLIKCKSLDGLTITPEKFPQFDHLGPFRSRVTVDVTSDIDVSWCNCSTTNDTHVRQAHIMFWSSKMNVMEPLPMTHTLLKNTKG